MKRLSKQQVKTKADLVERLRKTNSDLQAAIDQYNAQLDTVLDPLVSAIDAANEARDDARTFAEEVVGEMQDYAGERSDKWHESDAGSDFDSWQNEWEAINLDEVDIDLPEPIDAPDDSVADDFEALPEEATS